MVPVEFRCRSDGLSVGNDRELWKNGWLDRDAVWGGGSGGSKEPCIRWVISPQ